MKSVSLLRVTERNAATLCNHCNIAALIGPSSPLSHCRTTFAAVCSPAMQFRYSLIPNRLRVQRPATPRIGAYTLHAGQSKRMEICRPLQYMTACHAKMQESPSYSVPLELSPLLVRTTPSRRQLDRRNTFVAVPVLMTSFVCFLSTTLRHS